MTIGKFIIVFFTAVIVNTVLQSLGFSFLVQMLASAVVGLTLAFVDIVSEQGKK